MFKFENVVKRQEKRTSRLRAAHISTGRRREMDVVSKLLRDFKAADSIFDFIEENIFNLVVIGIHERLDF